MSFLNRFRSKEQKRIHNIQTKTQVSLNKKSSEITVLSSDFVSFVKNLLSGPPDHFEKYNNIIDRDIYNIFNQINNLKTQIKVVINNFESYQLKYKGSEIKLIASLKEVIDIFNKIDLEYFLFMKDALYKLPLDIQIKNFDNFDDIEDLLNKLILSSFSSITDNDKIKQGLYTFINNLQGQNFELIKHFFNTRVLGEKGIELHAYDLILNSIFKNAEVDNIVKKMLEINLEDREKDKTIIGNKMEQILLCDENSVFELNGNENANADASRNASAYGNENANASRNESTNANENASAYENKDLSANTLSLYQINLIEKTKNEFEFEKFKDKLNVYKTLIHCPDDIKILYQFFNSEFADFNTKETQRTTDFDIEEAKKEQFKELTDNLLVDYVKAMRNLSAPSASTGTGAGAGAGAAANPFEGGFKVKYFDQRMSKMNKYLNEIYTLKKTDLLSNNPFNSEQAIQSILNVGLPDKKVGIFESMGLKGNAKISNLKKKISNELIKNGKNGTKEYVNAAIQQYIIQKKNKKIKKPGRRNSSSSLGESNRNSVEFQVGEEVRNRDNQNKTFFQRASNFSKQIYHAPGSIGIKPIKSIRNTASIVLEKKKERNREQARIKGIKTLTNSNEKIIKSGKNKLYEKAKKLGFIQSGVLANTQKFDKPTIDKIIQELNLNKINGIENDFYELFSEFEILNQVVKEIKYLLDKKIKYGNTNTNNVKGKILKTKKEEIKIKLEEQFNKMKKLIYQLDYLFFKIMRTSLNIYGASLETETKIKYQVKHFENFDELRDGLNALLDLTLKPLEGYLNSNNRLKSYFSNKYNNRIVKPYVTARLYSYDMILFAIFTNANVYKIILEDTFKIYPNDNREFAEFINKNQSYANLILPSKQSTRVQTEGENKQNIILDDTLQELLNDYRLSKNGANFGDKLNKFVEGLLLFLHNFPRSHKVDSLVTNDFKKTISFNKPNVYKPFILELAEEKIKSYRDNELKFGECLEKIFHNGKLLDDYGHENLCNKFNRRNSVSSRTSSSSLSLVPPLGSPMSNSSGRTGASSYGPYLRRQLSSSSNSGSENEGLRRIRVELKPLNTFQQYPRAYVPKLNPPPGNTKAEHSKRRREKVSRRSSQVTQQGNNGRQSEVLRPPSSLPQNNGNDPFAVGGSFFF